MIRYYIVCVEDGELASETTELITCEYCEWWGKDKLYHCGLGNGYKFSTDYCSEADRREDDE